MFRVLGTAETRVNTGLFRVFRVFRLSRAHVRTRDTYLHMRHDMSVSYARI